MFESIYISTVFIAGVLSFFAPCIVAVIPVYIAYFTEDQQVGENGKVKLSSVPFIKAMVFVAGLSTSFILLGFGAGALGSVLYSDWFVRFAGLVVVILGLHQIGLLKLTKLYGEHKIHFKRSAKSDILGAYLLGFTFSFGWTPCVGPVLAAVLGLSASEGSALYGGFLMFIYSLGLMIPFLILTLFSDVMVKRIEGLYKHINKIKIAGGILIIIMGLLLMTNNLTMMVVWFERLFN